MKSLKKNQKGFTLIELLIVIVIIGILAAAILAGVDPLNKINQANDAKVQNDISGIGRAAEAYSITHNGFYPNALEDLLTTGELKRIPVPPFGYGAAYAVQNMVGLAPAPIGSGSCVDGAEASPTCTGIIITGVLKSKKFTSASTPVWRYESDTGQSCAVAAGGTCSAPIQPTSTPAPTPTPTRTPTPTP